MSSATNPTRSSIPEKRPAPSSNDESTTHSSAACNECRSRKVKCNRQLPECSNCKRSTVSCQYPSPEKKATQMKQLTEDVAQFNGRLATIEQSLVGRMQELAELVTQSMQGHSGRATRDWLNKSSPRPPSDLDDSDLDDDDLTEEDAYQFSNASDTSSRPSSIIVADDRGERFYGPCSTYSHMVYSKGLVGKLLNAGERPSSVSQARRPSSGTGVIDSGCLPGTPTYSELQRRYESFSGPANFQESFDTSDERPLELPPRQALHEAVEDFTSLYRMAPPLFNKQSLAAAIQEQYSANPSEIDESWVLCFNNIILRSQSFRARAFRFNSFSPAHIDAKTLQLLLGNANRALRQLEKFCGLRLVNVQALLLLAFVGRDLIHYNVFARIFDRVCQLAKQMGLHERQNVGEDSSAEDKEAQNVLRLLYLVDKQNIFIRGPPCRIYEFECNMSLPAGESASDQFVSAHVRLGCLIEEIYRHLYSPKAVKLVAAVRQRRVERLDGRLAILIRRVEDLASTTDKNSVESLMKLHLGYAFHVTRLLILSQSCVRKSKQTRRETARSALQIIQSLAEGSVGFENGITVLERLFSNYSVIAFHEIFESLITEGTSTDMAADLELLKCATRTLKMISQPDRPYSYCTRLHKNFVWCTEIATLVCDSRRSSAASSPQNHPSRRHSKSPSSNSNAITPQSQSRRVPPSLHDRHSTQTSSHFSSSRNTPPQDLGNDGSLPDDVYCGANAALTSNAAVAGTSAAMNPPWSAADFARIQNALQPQDYMFTGGTDDYSDLTSGAVMPNAFVTPATDISNPQMPIENSARFQEALKYFLSMGDGSGGFDNVGGFQQPGAMGDQMCAAMQYNNRGIPRSSI